MKKLRKCAVCGNDFIATHSNHRYCSTTCLEEGQRIIRANREGVEPFKSGTLKPCIICGKMFPAKTRKQVCCSEECVMERHRQTSRSFKERKAAGLVVPRKEKKPTAKPTPLSAKKIQELHDQGMTYAEYQIAKTMATIEPVRTVL